MTEVSIMPQIGMSPSKIRAAVIRILLAGLVAHVTASPGVGKSDIINSIADEYNLLVIDFRLAQCDVTDLNGLPRFTEDDRAEYAPFSNFPLEGDPLPINPKTGKPYDGWLLFFDELSSAPKQLQAAAYKILLDRTVGQRKLHPKVLMAAAGNKSSDRAVTHSMSTALQSRMVHLQLDVDQKEWMAWAIDNNIDSRILGFIEWQPEKLHQFDPAHNDQTYACPRTWAFTSKLIKGEPISIEDVALLAGTISMGIAQEFIQFARIYAELPKMSDVLAHPESALVPHEPSTRYAMATVIADHFTAATSEALCKYIRRYPVEIRVIILRIIHRRNPKFIQLPDVIAISQELVSLL